nr:ABC transporter permease [uncultured Emticicia sp.]
MAIICALAPLVNSLICTGKVNSSICAELGLMKVTKQIEALKVSAVNPFRFLIVSRVLASTLTISSTLVLLCLDGNGFDIFECFYK